MQHFGIILECSGFQAVNKGKCLFCSHIYVLILLQNSLRGRFGNALHWYSVLMDSKDEQITNLLNQFRKVVLTAPNGEIYIFDIVFCL